jgi:hypothetical protein
MSTASVMSSPVPSGPALAAAVARLLAEADAVQGLLAAGSLEQLSEPAVASATVALAAAAESATSAATTGLARVAGCGYPASEGYVTAASWWRAKTRISRDSAGEQIRLARRLASYYEATAAAWAGGEITGEHARILATGVDAVLARLVRRFRREHAEADLAVDPDELAAFIASSRTQLETELLALARRWGPETLRIALAQARELADPDGSSEKAMKAAVQASLTIDEVGDMAVITAQVTREVAAMVRTVLDHYRDSHYHRGDADSDAGAPQDVDPVTGRPVTLTGQQRDAAALEDWAAASLDSGLGNERVSERPHLDITATLPDLAAGTGTAILDRTGTPAPIHTARRRGCDADVRLVLIDGQFRDPQTGELVDPAVAGLLIAGAGVLDYGRAHRTVPMRLRRALGVRDRGCAFPGCHRPPQHTQAHHVKHWIDGGKTSLDNTVLLCSRHHHFVHEGGWRITPRAGLNYTQPGYWQFTPPRQTLP